MVFSSFQPEVGWVLSSDRLDGWDCGRGVRTFAGFAGSDVLTGCGWVDTGIPYP
jgi:hypothetical protein